MAVVQKKCWIDAKSPKLLYVLDVHLSIYTYSYLHSTFGLESISLENDAIGDDCMACETSWRVFSRVSPARCGGLLCPTEV